MLQLGHPRQGAEVGHIIADVQVQPLHFGQTGEGGQVVDRHAHAVSILVETQPLQLGQAGKGGQVQLIHKVSLTAELRQPGELGHPG